jgi:hypothetical protein
MADYRHLLDRYHGGMSRRRRLPGRVVFPPGEGIGRTRPGAGSQTITARQLL